MAAGSLDAFVFDLGGVIVAHDNPVMYARLASRCAPACSLAEVAAVAADARWATGASIRDLHEQLRVDAGYAAPWEVFVADWCCHFEVDYSMLALLEDLSRRRRVLIFSNTNAEHWAFLVDASAGRLAAFEAFLSYEIGCAKPSMEAFGLVADKAKIDPARSLFVDDLLANVEAARLSGFQADVFESETQLRALLAARGVGLH